MMRKITALTAALLISVLLTLLCSCGIGDGGIGDISGGGEIGGGSTDGDCAHADSEDDGLCDLCGADTVIILDLYALNDLHGKLDDADGCVGVDELTTYLKRSMAADEESLLLSSGDMWQGSSESNLTKGAIVTDWMNELGFVAMTLGNHEFDWGVEYIYENREAADFPMLAINVIDDSTGKRADFCSASVMVERGGIKIGIIGAIGDCRSSISASYVEGYSFAVGDELTELVKNESESLRDAGAELIIYSLHDGHGRSSDDEPKKMASAQMASYYDTELSEGYVDIVFEGHSHASYVHIDSYGVYHLQNGGYDDGISHVELRINFVLDTVSVLCAEIVNNYEYSHLEDDPCVDNLLEKYKEELQIADEILGFNNTPRDSYELRRLVAELYLDAGIEKWGAEYDLFLGGGFFTVRDPGQLGVGFVSYADLMSLLPFDNELVLCSISGTDLINRFLNSGNSNYFISLSEMGEAEQNSIKANETYYIITDTYSSDYAANRLTVVERYGDEVFARDLLAEYIRGGGYGEYTLTSIPEIIKIGEGLASGEETDEKYFVKGTICQTPTDKYGNTTIRDEEGNTLYVYGIKSNTGALFESIENKPQPGDTVILYGAVMNYTGGGDSLIELKNAVLISVASQSDADKE